MRDLLILAVFGAGLLYALRDPFVGLIVYTWISVMNPHRYAWGIAYDLPLAQAAAAVTLLSIVMHMDQIRFPRTRESTLFVILWVWITITTLFAFYPTDAWVKWTLVTKIFVMILVAMLLLTNRKRLIAFLVTLVGCVGFLGVKGALFGIMSGGAHKVWGPPESFLEDNNSAALAMVMTIPFCFFLREIVKKKWQSHALLAIGLSLITAALLTYSRGGFLGLVAVGTVIVVYSRRKLRIAAFAGTLLVAALIVLPPAWFARMSTVKTHDEDRSAQMRLNSWAMSFNLAKANPLGGGFECFTMEEYYKYAPDPELGQLAKSASTAHSIYFEILATQGFGGLAIFLLCQCSILLSMRRTQSFARKIAADDERVAISRAFTASVLGFMVSGAFLSMAFFDLYWWIFAAALCFKQVVLSGQWDGTAMPELRPMKPVLNGRSLLTTTDVSR